VISGYAPPRLRVGALARLLYGKSARKVFLLWSTSFPTKNTPRFRRICQGGKPGRLTGLPFGQTA